MQSQNEEPVISTDEFLAILDRSFGYSLPIRIATFDGKSVGPQDAQTTIVFKNANGISHVLASPGELGMCRAFVAGDIDIEGDIFEALQSRKVVHKRRPSIAELASGSRAVLAARRSHPPIPPEERKNAWRDRHSLHRDATAIASHYDVSNAFYEMVLGPTMTYSCGVWSSPTISLDDAQDSKYELICKKLALQPGMRLLDIGCGWGSMAIHAAAHHGANVVGVTISEEQAKLARQRVQEAGLSEQIEIRVEDYRQIGDGPYDAISSIGMFEHVGYEQRGTYFAKCFELLTPRGRFLNHFIARPEFPSSSLPAKVAAHGLDRIGLLRIGGQFGLPRLRVPARGSFFDRYVFPDGELQEVGDVVSATQQSGFEVRHVESLREHYALTLRAWIKNLQTHWDEAVAEVGENRARVWLLYMVGSVVGFEAGWTQLQQVLAVRPDADGESDMPLRPTF